MNSVCEVENEEIQNNRYKHSLLTQERVIHIKGKKSIHFKVNYHYEVETVSDIGQFLYS